MYTGADTDTERQMRSTRSHFWPDEAIDSLLMNWFARRVALCWRLRNGSAQAVLRVATHRERPRQ
eukprot:9259226-Prorocentrum_lima.AAC.1